jgi:dipeptide transport system ATP-binding protein
LLRYPHQLTIGVNQRVMIALALACEPRLLIADEPTTGLDVTIQAQTLDLLFRLNADHGTGLLLITHDFALLSRQVDHITVMYCGQVVESGSADDVLHHPRHPYSQALLDSIPHFDKDVAQLTALRGHTPSMHQLPVGCYFGPRCPRAFRDCAHTVALQHADEHRFRCLAPLDVEHQSS